MTGPIAMPTAAVLAGLGAPAAWAAPAGGVRARALAGFAASGLPTRRLEAWKYTDLSALKEIAFQPPASRGQPLSSDGVLPRLATPPAYRLVFVSGLFQPQLSAFDPPAGVELGSLAGALADDGLADPWLGDGAPSPMVMLNAGLATDGLLLRIAAGVTIDQPIELIFVGGLDEAATAWHPRHRIALGESSSASVVEIHVGAGGGSYLANHVGEFVIGANARLRHTVMQMEAASAYHIASRSVTVAADGRYEAFTLTQGGRLTRNEVAVSLDGPGASCGLFGAYLLRGREHCDNTTTVEHRAPHTACREVFKGVLDGAARGVFQGRIVVNRDAQKTDGYQLSKALLLSDDAEIDQKPELEIYADDVKCAHGAAAGQLDEGELFYLRSRGIPEEQARRLLIEGFLADVFDEVADDDLRAALFATARQWFGKMEGCDR